MKQVINELSRIEGVLWRTVLIIQTVTAVCLWMW